MSDSVAVVWDDSLLGYTMGGDHPMHPVRLDLTIRLADSLGVLARPRLEVVTPTPAGPAATVAGSAGPGAAGPSSRDPFARLPGVDEDDFDDAGIDPPPPF